MKAASKGLKRFTMLALALGLATSCATSSPRTNASGDFTDTAAAANEQEKKDQDQAIQQARFIKSSYNRW